MGEPNQIRLGGESLSPTASAIDITQAVDFNEIKLGNPPAVCHQACHSRLAGIRRDWTVRPTETAWPSQHKIEPRCERPPRPPFRRLRAMEKQTVLGLRDPESAGRVFESLTPHQIEKRLRAIGALFVCPRTLNEIRPAATQPAKPAQAARTSAVSAAPCPW